MGKPNMNLLKGIEAQENAMQEIRTEQIEAKQSRKTYTEEQLDEALKIVYRTGKQQDGADFLNMNKGTFSKKIREIEEKEPERVKRLKEEAGQDTPQTTQETQTATEKEQAEEITTAKENGQNEANTKSEKQSFSFRADKAKIEEWKLYAETVGGDIGNLWTAAIDEYIASHKLTADQQAVYDLKKQAADIQKRVNSK